MEPQETPSFPKGCATPGRKIAYVSETLLPQKRFEEYLTLLSTVLHEQIHYIDPVHEIHGKEPVLQMLKKYVPRAANDKFRFEMIHEDTERILWKWTIVIKIRMTPFAFTINGLVEAKVRNGLIYYQREYYDPMESIGVIPFLGYFYKLILRLG